jgi:tetratricopeptide (TPR) repeat protein
MAKDGSRLKPSAETGSTRSRGLPALVRMLALDSEWASLDAVMLEARTAGLSLSEIHDLARALRATESTQPAVEREAMAAEIHAAKRQAATLLLDRISRAALTADDREALLTTGGLLMDLGDYGEAAAAFERAGDDQRAAQAYGAAGDIDRMETCLAREDGQRHRRRDLRERVSRFETLLAAGQRLAALDMAAAFPANVPEAADLRAAAALVDQRLCRGRTVALRSPDGAVTRFVALPALLGRDGFCQIVLRDAGVSRRHARVLAAPAGFLVEDAGSRAGTLLCGARVSAPVPLPARGQLALGKHCRLDFATSETSLLELTGADGLDRGLRAFLGAGALPLAAAFPALAGLHVLPEERTARVECAQPARLSGQLVGPNFELLRGDVIEVAGQRLEIV